MPKIKLRSPVRNFCEFFAGIGLVRCGLEPSGWNCVYANDNDDKKREQYVEKFGGADFHLCDVFDTESITSKIAEPVTLATASFPCTDLSLAGHWKGIDGKHSSAVFGFLDCLKKLPTVPVLLLENVVGLLSSNKGADFQRLCELLSAEGYWLDCFRLDAQYFVPQSRPRIFIIAIHKSEIESTPFCRSTQAFSLGDSWERQIYSSHELRPKRLTDLICSTDLETGWFCSVFKPPAVSRVRLQALIDVDDQQEWWDETKVSKHHEKVDEALKSKSFFVGTIYRRKRHGKTRAEVRFDGIAGCLRTPKGGSARQIVIVTQNGNLKMRWMSPKEYARLQGVPDFPLVGRVSQQLFGFGDAVCVPAIKWIDDEVLTPIVNCFQEATV
jgi:DNA (cytosine-5)-methyltransferase 1